MKRLPALCRAIAAASLVLCCTGCRGVDLSRGDFTREVSVNEGHTSLPLDEDDPALAALVAWIQSPQPRWRRSLTTYAPGLEVRNARFSLNLLDSGAVLNFQPDPAQPKWVQVERDYDSPEPPAVTRLRARIKRVE